MAVMMSRALVFSPLAIGAGFGCRIGSCCLTETNGGGVSEGELPEMESNRLG